ncbi:tobamovirus multiplication protein 1-like isoform x1 [Anaeramoeba flamelloides]|uniref:Tobamovirus multiplication protein 1-like isoform x1 n=1 Tax=Anaeramoeba flamelloides TaxID=1746091 RepID=A0AAV7ZEN9_9EUKA|nr:tobamovirus multiplication protein 1-like isoform x1 [Anaeramoeba flamelloides]KAJ6245841.1 tobamovirus multiplication protein 1-like isoform x1 [Anaeramoeba flamelloides]
MLSIGVGIFGIVIIGVTENSTETTKWIKRVIAGLFLLFIYLSILLMDFFSWKIYKKFKTSKNFRRLFYILLIITVLFLVRVPWMLSLFHYEKKYKDETRQSLEWAIIYFCCSILSELLPNFLIILFVFENPKQKKPLNILDVDNELLEPLNHEYDLIEDDSIDEI